MAMIDDIGSCECLFWYGGEKGSEALPANRKYWLANPSEYFVRVAFASDTLYIGNEIGRWITVEDRLYALSRRCYLSYLGINY